MQRHPEERTRPLIAFDFDGTLTCRDSFVAFLAWRAGRAEFAAGLARLLPAALAYGRTRDRGPLKAAIARLFLGGMTQGEIAQAAKAFRDARMAALMRPDALRCWWDWRSRNARLFIVTASPEILVAPFAQTLGADGLIGTRLAFGGDGRFTGALDGRNCRGPEKVVRLRAALGPDVRLDAAYGDTDGDREMLEIADIAGLKVFKARP
jgi:phosphatidylglycerophosphatase C